MTIIIRTESDISPSLNDRRRGRHHRRYSDSDSFESGMGNSILEEGEGGHGRRRRRHHRGRHGSSGRYSSVESVESYVSEGGTRRERVVRRRRRRRSYDSSASSYYEGERKLGTEKLLAADVSKFTGLM